jgi:1-acyl-sn-glycerol-3-phosphate acyltransferase
MITRWFALDLFCSILLTVAVHFLAAFGDVAIRALGRNAKSRIEEGIAADSAYLFISAAGCGILIAVVCGSRYRMKGWIPVLAAVDVVAWAAAPEYSGNGWYVFALLLGFSFGGSIGILCRLVLPFLFKWVQLLLTCVLFVIWFFRLDDLFMVCHDPREFTHLFALFSATFLVLSLIIFARPLFELLVEGPTRVMYRVRAKGPGILAFPARGPVMVLANHAAYLDPLFLAGDIPRPLTPMMTSKFYDKWFIYPFVKYLLGVIRVPEVAVRREAPELELAIRALDEGKCLVIFPEGYLQRKADQPLRRFGRGVWEVLKARPGTPVVAAWIEGNWGSYFSYFNGPPTTGKKPDFRRPITIGYTEPFTVPKDVLEDHWATRFYLMNKVGGARALLGLPRIPEEKLPEKEEKGNHKDAENPEDAQRKP